MNCMKYAEDKEAHTSPQWAMFGLYSLVKTILELASQMSSSILRCLLTVGVALASICVLENRANIGSSRVSNV